MLLGYPAWTYLLWFIALLWFLGFIIYRQQRVIIAVDECRLSKSPKGNFICEMKVFVSSRHPDVLRKLELGIQPKFPIPASEGSEMPCTINSTPTILDILYSFSSNILNKAMQQQNAEWDIVSWLEATTSRGSWVTDGFLLPVKMVMEGGTSSLGLQRREGSLNKKTKRKRRKGLGITQEQFFKILSKVYKPFQKSQSDRK